MAPGPPAYSNIVPSPTGSPRHTPSPKSKLHDEEHALKRQRHRFSSRRSMSAQLERDHRPWLSRFRAALRLLIVVLSGAVAGTLIHTLEIHRGNRFIDLRSGELPMTWPARTNLAPTLVLCAVAIGNFLASVVIMSMSFKRSFRRPIRSRDAYRIVAGSFGVILWATAIVVFNFIDRASKASLGHYACMNRNVMSNGRYQYRAVCSEQGLAFYLAIGAACAEVVTLLTLAITALQSTKESNSILNLDEKSAASYRVTGRYP